MKTVLQAAVICAMVLAGCHAPPVKGPITTERARFFLEAPDGAGEVVILPQSGVKIAVQPKPVFTEFDIVHVDTTQLELGECLVFEMTPAASRDLQRLTTANAGRLLVLTLGGVAFGARRIDGPLTKGVLFMFVETPDENLPALVDSLNATSSALRSAAK